MPAKPTIVFAPETFNLAEVTRTLEIARRAQRSFEVVFTCYDAQRRNHKFIEGAGFEIVQLAPLLSEERLAWFWKKNRGEIVSGDYFTDQELSQRVESELQLYRQRRPVCIVTGFCLSTAISARAARIPLVWIAQTTWLLEYFQRFGTFPDAIDHPATRWLGDRVRDWASRVAAPFTFWTLNKGFNRIASRYGVAKFRGSSLLEGDYTLFAEPPEFSGLELPARFDGCHRFIGPLLGGLELPVPEAIKQMPRDLPIVYFAMGSSGTEDTIVDIVRAFEGQPYRVIAPVQPLLAKHKLIPPHNVIVTGWIPAEKVNPMADVSVLHGGIGTLMTACLAATPIVGIPNGNPEQEANLQCLVRKGMATHLHKKRLRPADLLEHINRSLRDERAKTVAREFAEVMARHDGPEEGARFLEETFLER